MSRFLTGRALAQETFKQLVFTVQKSFIFDADFEPNFMHFGADLKVRRVKILESEMKKKSIKRR